MTARPEAVAIRPADARYPQRLRRLGWPDVLHVWGALPDQPMVALVGTRAARMDSVRRARRMAADLVGAGYTIVSGGAIGVDAAAHEGALEGGGSTVAVLGSGLHRLYPQRNRELFCRIAEQGAVLSPFAVDAPPRRAHFPERNLLVAALARAVVVVEAPARSGALNTAGHARRLGVPVLAVDAGLGAIRLLRCGAALVIDGRDVLSVLDGGAPRRFLEPLADPELTQVLSLLERDGESGAGELAPRLGWSVGRTAAALIRLELAGWACARPLGRYAVVAARGPSGAP